MKRVYLLLATCLSVIPLGCGVAQGDQDLECTPRFVLIAEEIRLARDLAEERLDIIPDPRYPRERICFIKIDLLPDSQAHTDQRLVMVHHYRYRDDVTILTMVDLHSGQIVAVESKSRYPTALCEEERLRAEHLAGADPRVIAALPKDVAFEARPIHLNDANDQRFHHRLVQLMPTAGHRNLPGPRVLVDLTTETVYLLD